MKQSNQIMNRSTRRYALCATLALGLLASLATFEVAHAASGPVKARLGTLAPKGSSFYKHLQAMGEKWKQAPGGGVALTIYPDGTMGSEADMVRRMRLGQLQSGLLSATGLGEIEPSVVGLQNLPLMFRSLEEVDFITEKMQPLLEKRLAEKGFVVLFWSDAGWVRFFSKQPIISPEDLKKTKLFSSATSAAEGAIYRSMGCNPVSLETMDIMPNLQTGLINAVPLLPTFALAAQVDNVAPNMLDLPWVPLVGAVVMTSKTWDAVPPESREGVRQAAREAGKFIKADSRRESEESIDAMRKRGLKVNTVTPEIVAEWRQTAEAAYPKIRGGTVPADFFDEVVNQLKLFRAAKEGNKQ
ncbi:MAG: TRAP transporter substrate-binding protein DctP [Verrucomicrobiota bacterium]